MTSEIVKQLLQIEPPIEFIHWAKKWIKFLHQNESEFQEDILKGNRRQLTNLDQRLNKLLNLYIDENLDKKTYESKKKALEADKIKIKHKLANSDEAMNNWRTKVEDAIDFADAVASKFQKGLKEEKHQILIKISSDLSYKSKNPLIQLKNEYKSLKEIEKAKEKPSDVARTSKYSDVLVGKPELVPADSTWLERWYEFGRVDWVSELEYPEWTVKEVNRFLQQ